MTALRSRSLRSARSISWPGLVKILLYRYLMDDFLKDANEKVATIRKLLHENENLYADRLEDLA